MQNKTILNSKILNLLLCLTGGFALSTSIYTYTFRKLILVIDMFAFLRVYHIPYLIWGIIGSGLALTLYLFLKKFIKVQFFLLSLNLFMIYQLTGTLPGLMLWLLIIVIFINIFQKNLFQKIEKNTIVNLILVFLFINFFTITPYLMNLLTGFSHLSISAINLFIASSILIIPVLFFPKIVKPYLFFLFVIMTIPMLISTLYAYVFGIKISEEAFFVVVNSNNNEAYEFLETYLKWDVLLIALLLIGVAIALILNIGKDIKLNLNQKIMLSVICISFTFTNENHEYNSTVSAINKINRSKREYEKLKKLAVEKEKRTPFSNIQSIGDTAKNQTYVLIINESLTSKHMGIYGYNRPTTPKLSALKDELYLFNDVISSDANTIRALQKVLSFGNTENMKPYEEYGSIIDYMNTADFNTYWISNQYFSGVYENVTTMVASSANETYFVNDPSVIFENSYDESVLKSLDQVLSNNNKKKFIVVHLFGCHYKYKERYPASFINFTSTGDIPKNELRKDVEFEIINSYDNAVSYSDFIISEVIKKVKNLNSNSYVSMFSDHGEELYDEIDFAGHDQFVSTKAMFPVPLLFWFSDDYKNSNPQLIQSIKNNKDKKYQIDDLIHTIIDISNLPSKHFEPSKSITNKAFKERIRKMGVKKTDYDKL